MLSRCFQIVGRSRKRFIEKFGRPRVHVLAAADGVHGLPRAQHRTHPGDLRPRHHGSSEGSGLPGIGGVLQAQYNPLFHLIKFPDTQSLRRILDSQRIVSREVAPRIALHSPAMAARWERRAEVYGQLVHETRDLGGPCGKGGPSAGQGSVAAARM